MKAASPPVLTEQFHHALVIYNPTAGTRRRRRVEAVLEGLARQKVRYGLFSTSRVGDAEDAARHAGQNGHDLIIAAGGDGTVNEVANLSPV